MSVYEKIIHANLEASQAGYAAGMAAERDLGISAKKLRIAVKALESIANINNGPDRASGEYRCQEAALCASNALEAIRGLL